MGQQLTTEELLQLHTAIADAHMQGRRELLLRGLPREFAAGLPQDPNPLAQLLIDLQALNTVGQLADGSLPLRVWLLNAVQLATSSQQRTVLQNALQRLPLSGALEAPGQRGDASQRAAERLVALSRQFMVAEKSSSMRRAEGAVPNLQRPLRILFLAANPSAPTRLALDQECRQISASLSKARGRFDFRQEWAVRAGDVQALLLSYQPDVVHFSGHGNQAGELLLSDEAGEPKPVSPEALSRLFDILRLKVRCVVLNACYSAPLAEAISKFADGVVGISSEISDASAIAFSSSFYQALAFGQSLRAAFELGSGEIQLLGMRDHEAPILAAQQGVAPHLLHLVESAPVGDGDALESQQAGERAETWNLVLDSELENLDQEKLGRIVEHLQALTGDKHLRLRATRRGSVVLTLESSADTYKVLCELHKSGQLKEVIGLRVISIDRGGADPIVDLNGSLTLRAADQKQLASLSDTAPHNERPQQHDSEDCLSMPISRSRLRETLNVSLKSDADFDAFCQDHFPEVYKLFSDGMNRVRKTNVLFEQVEAVQIREALSGQARDVPSLPASSHDLSRAKALQPAAITTNRPASGSRAPASAGSVAPIDGVPAKEGARSTSVETPTRQISHAKVPAVIGALVLVVAALVTVGLMRPPTCPAGRTHFQGACVADHIVDLVKCLEGHKVTKAAEAAERGVRSAAKEGGDDLDVQVRDKVEQEFATLSGDDLRTVILSCAKETSDAELRLPPMTQATASVAPSPTATGMPSAQAPAPTVRLSTDRILQVETPDGERLTVAVKLPEGQAAYLFHVLNPEYDWAYAESKEARLNGQKRDIYREFLDTESFRSAAACSLGIVGVGVASEEGGRAEEEDRAFDRAGQLATWFKLATPSQPLLPTYKLLLGKYARTGASPADKGAKTRGQRKVIVILILAESGHVDHQKGAFLAISRIEANLQGVELKKYSLHKEGFKWLASSGGAPYRPVIPPQCTRYVFE